MNLYARILAFILLTCCNSTSFGAAFTAKLARHVGCYAVVFGVSQLGARYAHCVDGDERGDDFRGRTVRASVTPIQHGQPLVPHAAQSPEWDIETYKRLLQAIREHNTHKTEAILTGRPIPSCVGFEHPLMIAVRNLCKAAESTAAADLEIMRLLIMHKIEHPWALRFLAEQAPTKAIRTGIEVLLASGCVSTDLELKTTAGKTVGETLFEKYGFDLHHH